MDVLVLLSVIALVGLLNLLNALISLIASPYGFALGAVVASLSMCTFTTFCPVSVFARRFCASVGCKLE